MVWIIYMHVFWYLALSIQDIESKRHELVQGPKIETPFYLKMARATPTN